ncbi:MAG: SLBB domain-containing protein [Chloroflexi bacterium]|nr:SLBB domain-containing protein [Chloroflexota bacterium]
MTSSDCRPAWQILRDAAVELSAAQSNVTRVVVQWGHCSQAVGAGDVHRRLANLFQDRGDVSVVAAGCDGACFAATQVVVELTDGTARFFDRVASDGDFSQIVAAANGGAPEHARPQIELEAFFSAQHVALMEGIGSVDPVSLDEYLAGQGYLGLADALSMSPDSVIALALDAGLLGRGGAYFPAARKWQAARRVESARRHLVVNAEEGEPGVFKDRHLMEGNPHRIIEGALIAAYAAGAGNVVIYINAEADLSADRMTAALEVARTAGLVGDDVLGSGFDCAVTVRRGAGGYVCGEETTLLNTVEGRRREPRLRPPFPTDAGLYGEPTVINNAETVANLPAILLGGVRRFASVGLIEARGTRLVSLSGAVQRPGLAEVPMGTTVRQVIDLVGGGVSEGREIGFAAVGGPSSGLLPASELDVPLRPGMLHPSGVVMGAGGITVFDDRASPAEVAARLSRYNAAESCGKCTPCREGTPRIAEALGRIAAGDGKGSDVQDLQDLAEIVGAASLCGLGQMAGNPVTSLLHFYGDALGITPSR